MDHSKNYSLFGFDSQGQISYKGRCATKLRSRYTVVGCCFKMFHPKCYWTGWHWFWWMGCMLTITGYPSQHVDLEYHLQQASKSCFPRIVQSYKTICFHFKRRYFHALGASSACLASGHRAIHNCHLTTWVLFFQSSDRRQMLIGNWHDIFHVGSWKDAALDDLLPNSQLEYFVNFVVQAWPPPSGKNNLMYIDVQ